MRKKHITFLQDGKAESDMHTQAQCENRYTSTHTHTHTHTLTADSSLTTVDLTDSGIGDEGAALVATACASNSAVTVLGLSGNRLGDRCVDATMHVNANQPR